MNVFASFESTLQVEIALAKLKEQDIEDHCISFVEMEMNVKDKHILDTMYHSNGISLFDSVAAWGVAGATLGCIYGSVMRVGPIIIGLLGAAIGGAIALLLDLLITKKRNKKWKLKRGDKNKYYDILLIVQCNSKQEMKNIISICKNNNALSLGVHT